ncbi:MAG: ATP-binding protein, partial [Dehalococcoidales bacterium]|nr:ATP-binding protein [Dehalococcoidales bacterium]
PVRLQNLAVKAADEIRHRFHNHKLLVDFPHGFPIVDADPERILQVIRQLLDNAVKYSSKGGLIILQGKITKEHAVISVADEGVGIAPEDLNHLFDRFFRAKSNSGNQVIGTGLGLPISRAIIEAHGGRIWAESVLGQGSRFYFSLPLNGPSQKLED